MPLHIALEHVYTPPQDHVRPGEQNKNKTNRTNTNKSKRWNNEKGELFVECIDFDTITDIESKLNDDTLEKVEVIDSVCTGIASMFDNAGKGAFGTTFIKSRGRNDMGQVHSGGHRVNKPFFNRRCKLKRSEFHRYKKRYNVTKTKTDFDIMKNSGKEYKKEMRKAHTAYEKETRDKIRNMRKKGKSREYWNLLKDKNKKDDSDNYPDIEKFYTFFKNLNTADTTDTCNEDVNITPNHELDRPFTQTDIL